MPVETLLLEKLMAAIAGERRHGFGFSVCLGRIIRVKAVEDRVGRGDILKV